MPQRTCHGLHSTQTGRNVNTSVHLSHCSAPTISGPRPHSGYDQALHGCGPESSGASQSWPDAGRNIHRPQEYGEEKFVVIFGGLHIEMTALKTLGDWLQGSGWVQALVQAETATADSFLRASHVSRNRRAHQVTLLSSIVHNAAE